jgi:hypothetical protein
VLEAVSKLSAAQPHREQVMEKTVMWFFEKIPLRSDSVIFMGWVIVSFSFSSEDHEVGSSSSERDSFPRHHFPTAKCRPMTTTRQERERGCLISREDANCDTNKRILPRHPPRRNDMDSFLIIHASALFVCLFVLFIHRPGLAWGHAGAICSGFPGHLFTMWLSYIQFH